MKAKKKASPSPSPAPARGRPPGKARVGINASLDGPAAGLGHVMRWRILLELAKGEALPNGELRRRLEFEKIGNHLEVLVKLGWVQKRFKVLYALGDKVRVDTEAGLIDLGPVLLKFTVPGKG